MYSLTQGGNLSAIIGVVMLVLNVLKINITQEEIQTLVGAVLSLAGILISWYGRYRHGDLTIGGFKKNV